MLSKIVGFDGSCLSGLSLRNALHTIFPAVAEESGKWSRQMISFAQTYRFQHA